jgi:hypothetical protein
MRPGLFDSNAANANAEPSVGYTDDLERRLNEHEQGNGSKMLAAVARAGIPWQLARTWPRRRVPRVGDRRSLNA